MHDGTWKRTGRTFGGSVAGQRKASSVSRTKAMKALGSVIYAARLSDGTIKIGWTEHFDERLNWLRSRERQDVELLAFMLGDYEDEQSIHADLAEHRHHAVEFYNPTSEVLNVVNAMRRGLGLSQIAA